ncbi:hypothetical protein ACHWQZ_G017664 [Mnemiopsis leidyi]
MSSTSVVNMKFSRQRVDEISERLFSNHTVASKQHLRTEEGINQRQKSRPKTAHSNYTSYTESEVEEVVKRLSQCKKEVTDSRRTGSNKTYGIVNTYAWRGWNSELPHIYWRYNYPRNYLRSA